MKFGETTARYLRREGPKSKGIRESEDPPSIRTTIEVAAEAVADAITQSFKVHGGVMGFEGFFY